VHTRINQQRRFNPNRNNRKKTYIEKGVENRGVDECGLRKRRKWKVSLKKIGNSSNLRLITLKHRRPRSRLEK
jgi:hypothetical protein